jgi:hypothetical protein
VLPQLKKLLVPTGATKEIDAVEMWVVSWRVPKWRSFHYESVEQRQYFAHREDAKHYCDQLNAAAALLGVREPYVRMFKNSGE